MGKMIVGGKPGGGAKRPCVIFCGEVYAYSTKTAEPTSYENAEGRFSAPDTFDISGKTMRIFLYPDGLYTKSILTDSADEQSKSAIALFNAAGAAGVELTPDSPVSIQFKGYTNHYVKLDGTFGVPTVTGTVSTGKAGPTYLWTFSVRCKRWADSKAYPYSVIVLRIEFYD